MTGGSPARCEVFPDAAGLARAAGAFVEEAGSRSIRTRGAFRLAVPGGRSVRGLLETLARGGRTPGWDWARVTVFFADERAVAPEDPESNYRLVREALLEPLGALAPRVERMRADAADVEAAALTYERLLETPLDLVVLGLGEDGHVASLFPGSPLLGERERRVAVVADSPKPPARRLTLTPRAILEAREGVLGIASGAGKADALRRTLAGEASVPAALFRHATWLADAAAAAGLDDA